MKLPPLPKPRVGQVIRHSFLFSSGDEKDRPGVIVVAVDPLGNEEYHVAVMPITHSFSRDPRMAVEILQRLKSHLGLDDDRSWVVINEVNAFQWPGYDLRRIQGGGWEYGQMPPRFMEEIVGRVKELEARPHVILRNEDSVRDVKTKAVLSGRLK